MGVCDGRGVKVLFFPTGNLLYTYLFFELIPIRKKI